MNKTIKIVVMGIFILINFSCRESIKTETDTGNGLVDPPLFGPGLTVLSPAAGDIWKPGSSHEIKWDVDSNEFLVDIHLYRKTEFKFAIAERIENDGSFLWWVPNTINQSHHYRIHILYSQNPFQNSFKSEEFYVID